MVVEVEVEMEMVVGSEMEMGMGKIEFVGFVDARMEWNRNEWRGNDAATGSCRVAVTLSAVTSSRMPGHDVANGIGTRRGLRLL